MITKEDVIKALKEVMDPEIGISVIDLGLIYGIKVSKDKVNIKMTLTTPACPMGAIIVQSVKEKVENVKGVKQANVELVFEPPWNPKLMSSEARKQLGIK